MPWLQGLHDQGVFRQLLSAHVRRHLRHDDEQAGSASEACRAVARHAGRHGRQHANGRPPEACAGLPRQRDIFLYLWRRRRRHRHRRRTRFPSRKGNTCNDVRRTTSRACRRHRHRGSPHHAFRGKARRRRHLDQWRILCPRTPRARIRRGRFDDLGTRAAGASGARRAAIGLHASWLLAANGHPARQSQAGRIVAIRPRAMEGMALNLFGGVYAGRRVLVTGHTGFKGSWLVLWLRELGAHVAGLALDPDTQPSHWTLMGFDDVADHRADLRDAGSLRKVFDEHRPEIVLHLAAQPLVRRSYRDPIDTFSSNVTGLINLFEAVRVCPSVRVVVNATTDKVYAEHAVPEGYRETDPLGGHDPYSTSKACAELVSACYRKSFFDASDASVQVATVRAG